MTELNAHKQQLDAFGYTCVKQAYDKADIDHIAEKFDRDFLQRLADGQVQSRDYRRYACKLPICDDYLPILNNPKVHALLTEVLGEDYVLFNFNSHSSLPGSSAQIMHVDTVDPRNSQSYVNAQTNVVFLHIPMLDTQKQHGTTGIWPATLFRQTNSIADSDIYQWAKENLPQSSAQLQRGDVILKRDNCIHAGGANRSEVRRHMITLIFARKHYYLTYNSGMIPCQDYSQVLSQKLPYIIASDCQKPPQSSQAFQQEKTEKVQFDSKKTRYSIEFLQFATGRFGNNNLLTRLADDNDINAVFNTVSAAKPLLQCAFRNAANIRLHKVSLSHQPHGFDCDDVLFKQEGKQSVINEQDTLITLHIALEDCEYQLYAGNKVLSKSVLSDSSNHAEQIKTLNLRAGDYLLTTGSTIYAKNSSSASVKIVFTQDYFIPSYDDRLYISDRYFLSLPNSLSPLIRYDQVFITEENYKHFQYNRRTHFAYIVVNTLGNIKVKNKLLGLALTAVSAVTLAPIGIYFLARRTKSKAKQILESY